MKHNELKGAFDSVRSSWVFSLAALTLFDSDETKPILANFHVLFGKHKIPFTDIYNTGENFKFGVKEFLKMALRAVVKESYNLIYDYCKETGQLSKLKSQSWFHFTRLIRNALSHNFKFVFKNRDKEILPISWNKSTIDINLDGKDLHIGIIGYEGVWKLLSDMRDFILYELS